VQLVFGNGGDGDVTDIGHAGESLAAESHRLDALQVLKRGELGRRVALAQNRQVLKLQISGIKTRAQCEMTRRMNGKQNGRLN